MVKVCGLSAEADVRAAVAAGADAVGFVFAESKRRVTPAEARRAARIVPPHVRRVAVMRHPTNEEWREVLETFEPDVLQTDAGDLESLDVPPVLEVWPVLREGSAGTGGSMPGVFLYEGSTSGAGVAVDWARAAEIAARGRMILAGGLSAGNVAEAIRRVKPWGVDVSSGVESGPGQKDANLIRQFVTAARAAEAAA